MLAVAVALLSGCATITRGTHEALTIESEPSGALVRLSDGQTGTTPTSFRIHRKGDLVVTVMKDGFDTVTVHVITQVAGGGAAAMAGNVLVGGLIGAGIDAYSGGMLEHKPNPVRVTMVAARPPPPPTVVASPIPVPAPANNAPDAGAAAPPKMTPAVAPAGPAAAKS